MNYQPDEHGYWGQYGGRFVPETLVAPLDELTAAYFSVHDDPDFQAEFNLLLKDYVGRPSPLFHAKRLSEKLGGAKIYLKREDLLHTGFAIFFVSFDPLAYPRKPSAHGIQR